VTMDDRSLTKGQLRGGATPAAGHASPRKDSA
jgi:hypothetical protein